MEWRRFVTYLWNDPRSILLIWFFDVCWCNLNIVLVVKFIRPLFVFGLYWLLFLFYFSILKMVVIKLYHFEW